MKHFYLIVLFYDFNFIYETNDVKGSNKNIILIYYFEIN